jgi:uronate dehydrogenase
MAKVLVTGSAGAIGQPVCRELERRGHQVRGLDRIPTPGVSDHVVTDTVDRERVRAAVLGMDAVVHLAAEPNDADFSQLVGPNVVGLFHVMDAARQAGVGRVVLASSIQVLGRRGDASRPARVDEASPGNHYALTKLWAEQMGEMYVRRFAMSVIAVRIAWMVRNPAEARTMFERPRPNLYLSAHDAGRFFALAVEAREIGFAVLYAASLGGEELFDMEPARRLIGYQAEDRWPRGLDFELPDAE